MKRVALTLAVVAALLAPASARAQVAGRTKIGVAVAETEAIFHGWSAKKHLLGMAVYDEGNEKIGTIDDIIITPDQSASFAIIGTGGFVGIAKHDVAIPFAQLKQKGEKLVLPGATKDALKALPEFEYASAK